MCNPITTAYPDHLLIKGMHAGLEWEVTKNHSGYRCGYVRVPVGHPWHGKDYGSVDVNVHGGLTFAEPDTDCGKGGDDNAWWFGFDCAHAWDAPDLDLMDPEYRAFYESSGLPSLLGRQTVRRTEFVKAQCEQLAEQIAAADGGNEPND